MTVSFDENEKSLDNGSIELAFDLTDDTTCVLEIVEVARV